MTPDQLETMSKIAGTVAAAALALTQVVQTALDIADQLRRRRLDRRGPPRRRRGPRR